jgi:hypothetical protein
MYAVRVTDACATEFRIRSPVMDAVWIILFERRAGRLVLPGSDEPAIGKSAPLENILRRLCAGVRCASDRTAEPTRRRQAIRPEPPRMIPISQILAFSVPGVALFGQTNPSTVPILRLMIE